jgi:hypothetical protein
MRSGSGFAQTIARCKTIAERSEISLIRVEKDLNELTTEVKAFEQVASSTLEKCKRISAALAEHIDTVLPSMDEAARKDLVGNRPAIESSIAHVEASLASFLASGSAIKARAGALLLKSEARTAALRDMKPVIGQVEAETSRQDTPIELRRALLGLLESGCMVLESSITELEADVAQLYISANLFCTDVPRSAPRIQRALAGIAHLLPQTEQSGPVRDTSVN